MFKRKLNISILLGFIVTLIFSAGDALSYGFARILDGWFNYSLFVFPCLLFYALPVSLISEAVTRGVNYQFKRRFFSMVVHIGAAVVLYFWNESFAILAFVIAIVFYILDEVSRSLGKKVLFQRTFNFLVATLCILSVGFWVTAAIQIW